ncbi:MAG: hypothetical protein HY716_03115 [Planctomycetes bacterium]|nr:hypothetical protein [Planctomycetota bacterium]
MNKLKQNLFWVGSLAAAGVAVVALAVLVVPMWSEADAKLGRIDKIAASLSSEVPKMPGQQNVAAWKERLEKLETEFRSSAQSLIERDKPLEEWFAGFNKAVTYNAFMTRYNDETSKLDEELRKKGILIGVPRRGGERQEILQEDGELGFNWVTSQQLENLTIDQQNEVKVKLQKRFWICRTVADLLLIEDNKPVRLLDVYFPEPLTASKIPGISDSGTASTTPEEDPNRLDKYRVLQDRVRLFVRESATHPPITQMPRGFFEQNLPGNGETVEGQSEKPLGRTITFGFAVDMEYDRVPKLVRNFLAPPKEPALLWQMVGLNVFVPRQNEPEKTQPFEYTDDTRREKELELKAFEEQTKNSKPAPVRVYMTCQVFDFEPENLPSFFHKSP